MFSLEIIEQLNSNKCKRCGLCCQKLVDSNFWKQSKITEEQKNILLKERKNYPQNKEGCKMLIFKDKIAICLLQKLIGRKAQSDLCKNYPKPRHKICLREKEELAKQIA